jgi:tripartite-type tricarboxylate transporter receptor subunit TctC
MIKIHDPRGLLSAWAAVVCLLSGAMNPGFAFAQTDRYPTRTIKLIMPATAGGPADLLGRIAAEHLSKSFGQPVVVENIPGAGGNTGLAAASRAAPDGYTILLASQGMLSLAPWLFKELPFDPDRDFAPVVLIAAPPYVLVVNPGVAANNLKELIALARSKPGALNFASTNGNASSSHIAGELFKKMAKVDIVHVPFKGDAVAAPAVLAGDVQMMFSLTAGVAPNIRAGKFRAIAIGSAKRSAALPDVPTFDEAGLPGFTAASWFAILTRSGVPTPIIARLNDELNRMLALSDVRKRLLGIGAEPAGGTAAELADHLRNERAKWGQVIREAKITLD